jgi:2-polyprenyl-6-methoxyphenol hydroxylase-like FAD-dependent oxidoreductase
VRIAVVGTGISGLVSAHLLHEGHDLTVFENLGRMRSLGLSERFLRMWEYYLCYWEGGFRERAIGAVQMLLEKPMCRQAPLLGHLG